MNVTRSHKGTQSQQNAANECQIILQLCERRYASQCAQIVPTWCISAEPTLLHTHFPLRTSTYGVPKGT
jgi:hypothetical protein